MKRKDVVFFKINDYLRRAVVKALHRDGTATIEGLNGPSMGRTLRLFIGDLEIERYASIERAFVCDAERQKTITKGK